MGAVLMSNTGDVNEFKHMPQEAELCLSCQAPMTQSFTDFSSRYKDVTLTLRHLPVFSCTKCTEEEYDAGKLYKCLGLARAHFDATGEVVYACE